MSEENIKKRYHPKKLMAPCGFHCIKIKDLSVSFAGKNVIHDINMHIHCGTISAIIGRNGAGKSTLFRAVLGEVKHTGTVEFRNRENGPVRKMKISYIPQKLNIDRTTPMDVYDLMASYISRVPIFVKSMKTREKIIEALSLFDAADLVDKSVGALSGGQLQRVLLSLAVMEDPDLMLLDEPVSGVDQNGLELFYHNMAQLRDHFDVAVMIISHDFNYVAKYADKVYLLDRGTIADSGTMDEVRCREAFKKAFSGEET